jgi:hypothetical protein
MQSELKHFKVLRDLNQNRRKKTKKNAAEIGKTE